MFKSTIKVKHYNTNVVDCISKNLPNAIEQVIKYGQDYALKSKRGNKDKKLIPYEIKNDNNVIIGRLYTNFKHATFLEYGTGKLSDGTMAHIGHTKTFKLSGMTYWWIPPALSKNGEWQLVYTQPARPFMRPTAFELRNNAAKIIVEDIKKGLKNNA